jgi:hypothetical protein
MAGTIKWKRTNMGNLLFALYKGKVKRHKAVLTDDWQDRLEICEWEDDVYDTIVVKPSIKESHRGFVFSETPKWEGELTLGQWHELKPLSFDAICQRLQKKSV